MHRVLYSDFTLLRNLTHDWQWWKIRS